MLIMIQALAIINPISGTGKQKRIAQQLKNNLDQTKFHLEIVYTAYAGHGVELAKQAIADNFDAVIAVGGDGTINEIANALVFSNVAMGIIPCGSGNGLARHLGIPMSPVKAIKWLNKAVITKMDTVQANDFRFVNVAGIGFDALVSHEFAKMNSRGLTSYVKAVIKEFRTFETQQFTLQDKTGEQIESGMVLSFANASQFGNNTYIAPEASISDGLLNIVLLKKPKWYQVAGLGLLSLTKKIHRSKLFKEFIVDEITITQQSDLGHIDGEPILFGKTIHLKVDKQSLKIFGNADKTEN